MLHKTREPSKIYRMRDVGVEVSWSVVYANHDSALFDGRQGAVND